MECLPAAVLSASLHLVLFTGTGGPGSRSPRPQAFHSGYGTTLLQLVAGVGIHHSNYQGLFGRPCQWGHHYQRGSSARLQTRGATNCPASRLRWSAKLPSHRGVNTDNYTPQKMLAVKPPCHFVFSVGKPCCAGTAVWAACPWPRQAAALDSVSVLTKRVRCRRGARVG